MTAPCLGFTGFESGNEATFYGGGWKRSGDGDSVQAGTALVGTYSYECDPVNANATFKFYGPQLVFPIDNPSTLRIMSVFHIRMPATFYDEIVAIYELISPGINVSRRLTINTTDKLQLFDKDEDSIAGGSKTLVAGANYLIRVDTQLNRDRVYLYDTDGNHGAPQWYTEISVDDWGDMTTPFSVVTFGTNLGKTLPTTGTAFYLDEIGVFDMEGSTPAADSIGSVETHRQLPDGVSGDNNDFPGTVADVDEVPNDGNTSYDESGTAGHQQGYDVADPADATDVPLACQPVGNFTRNGGSGNSDIDYKYGFYRPTGSVFDMSDTITEASVSYRPLGFDQTSTAPTPTIWNDFNGSPWTNPIFDEIEATVEVVTANNSAKFRLSNIGVEYYINGAVASPADFPDAPTATGTGTDAVIIGVV